MAEASLGLEILLLILRFLWIGIWIFTLIRQGKDKRFWWLGITALIQMTLIVYWIVWIFSPRFRENN